MIIRGVVMQEGRFRKYIPIRNWLPLYKRENLYLTLLRQLPSGGFLFLHPWHTPKSLEFPLRPGCGLDGRTCCIRDLRDEPEP